MFRGEEELLRVGTLEDIFVASQNTEKPMVLNCLNLPMPHGGIFAPPRFRYDSVSPSCHFSHASIPFFSELASDQYAWAQTSGSAGFCITQPPSSELGWGTVGTAGATSWLHIDTEGMGTSSQLLTGAKYWVVFYRDPGLPHGYEAGDMASIHFKDQCYWDEHELTNSFCAEAVTLRPGMVL
jgi:hypothetical protein